MNREQTYWAGTGTHQELSEKLEEMIPSSDEVENVHKNPKLERLRKLINAYYDLFNNGGMNTSRGTAKYFSGTITLARYGKWEDCYDITEPIMDKAILKAAKEQGLIKHTTCSTCKAYNCEGCAHWKNKNSLKAFDKAFTPAIVE